MRLQEKYKKEIVPAMLKKFGYKSVMAVPKIQKIIVNCGFGKMIVDKSSNEREAIQKHILEYLALITGQKPVIKKAKQSIAAFKLRQGLVVGLTVVLRKKMMYDFLERLIFVVLPRVRDFRGIDIKSISEQGDLTIGFKEFVPFPEVKIEKEKGIFGLEITIVNSAKTKEEGVELMRLLGVPLKIK